MLITTDSKLYNNLSPALQYIAEKVIGRERIRKKKACSFLKMEAYPSSVRWQMGFVNVCMAITFISTATFTLSQRTYAFSLVISALIPGYMPIAMKAGN